MAKANLHPLKVLLSVWWDCSGIIFFELLLRGEIITVDKYCDQLTKLNLEMQAKRSRLANRKYIFHHGNARPRVAQKTLRKLKDLNWEILQHPPHSLYLVSSDFHLFRSLQNNLNGKHFDSVEAVKN